MVVLVRLERAGIFSSTMSRLERCGEPSKIHPVPSMGWGSTSSLLMGEFGRLIQFYLVSVCGHRLVYISLTPDFSV